MKQRLLVIALAVGCVIAGGIAYFLSVSQDHEAPEITVEDRDVTYTEGESYNVLLEGVTASDNRDGDVTDQVFVDKIRPTGEDTAIAYYGVMDSSKNVGTATRKITYIAASDEGSENEGEETPEDASPAEETSAGDAGGADAGTAEELEPDGANPVIALNTDHMTIEAGGDFDVLSIVRGVADDKDSTQSLYTNIRIDGEYDTETPGSYEIRYYVVDSDGNESKPQAFTLTVE